MPVVLRKMGLLEYSSALSDAIERGEEIPSGSRMEVEIRACSVVAVERMREAFK